MKVTSPRTMTTVDYVNHLTRQHAEVQHSTPDTRAHVVLAPPLLVQLAASDIPSKASGSDTVPGYESKPVARLDAIDALADVTTTSSTWIRTLGARPRPDAIGLVLQIHGLLPQADPATRAHIEKDIRHWWTMARIVTGWDSPPWRPDATCPSCNVLGGLRVRLADRLASCIECKATWNVGTIGLLADHIRAESADRQSARANTRRSPCWCPWPKPIVPDLKWVCPACGSARCHHAVSARGVAELRAGLATEAAAG